MFRISDAIRSTPSQDGTVVLNIHHGEIFCLNVLGSKVFDLLKQGRDESSIADEISREYGANREIVRADVLEFIETLEKHQILQPIRSSGISGAD
ncbi:MAG: PqqD family protein [Candidatus Acidiferrales bacterium]